MEACHYGEPKIKSLFLTLKKDPTLGNLSLTDLFELIELSDINKYDQGELIIKQGEQDSYLYVLIEGSILITHNDKAIRKLNRVGEIVGEMSLISHEPRSASVVADSGAVLMCIDAAGINNGKNAKRSILYYIFCQILARRLKVVNQELSGLKERLKMDL